MFRNIMVPLDGSERAEKALPYAQYLAGTNDGTIHLAYVIEPWQSGDGYEVSVVHARSNRVMASFTIKRVDELFHPRIRQLMEVVVTLTDWTRGVKDILSEKRGEGKQASYAASARAPSAPLFRSRIRPAPG